MRVTIAGGGNIGTQFAVHCAEKGHEVTIYTSKPEVFASCLEIVNETGEIIQRGRIVLATNDAEKAFRFADLIFVTMPANRMRDISKLIYDHTGSETIIGVVPGNGGSECFFKQCIERGNVFFGIERVPAIARLVKKGKTVRSTGYRNELHVASLPKMYAEKCASIVEGIFDIKTTTVPCFLNLTMTPSNPILHTARLRNLFGDWHEGKTYDHVPLFYEEWDDASSQLLIECDEEVQSICHALSGFNLKFVKSLRDHYESATVEDMTKKLSSIAAFKGLTAPTIQVGNGLIPDLHSRYFTADFSFGLTIIKQVADFAGVLTPNIDETMAWYKSIAVETDEFRFDECGITDRSSFERFYLL